MNTLFGGIEIINLFYIITLRETKIFCCMTMLVQGINLPLFSTFVPSNICMFLSCRPFIVKTTLSAGLVGVEFTSTAQARRQT